MVETIAMNDITRAMRILRNQIGPVEGLLFRNRGRDSKTRTFHYYDPPFTEVDNQVIVEFYRNVKDDIEREQ